MRCKFVLHIPWSHQANHAPNHPAGLPGGGGAQPMATGAATTARPKHVPRLVACKAPPCSQPTGQVGLATDNKGQAWPVHF